MTHFDFRWITLLHRFCFRNRLRWFDLMRRLNALAFAGPEILVMVEQRIGLRRLGYAAGRLGLAAGTPRLVPIDFGRGFRRFMLRRGRLVGDSRLVPFGHCTAAGGVPLVSFRTGG